MQKIIAGLLMAADAQELRRRPHLGKPIAGRTLLGSARAGINYRLPKLGFTTIHRRSNLRAILVRQGHSLAMHVAKRLFSSSSSRRVRRGVLRIVNLAAGDFGRQ
jgi:hypothetical protein